MLLKKVEVSHSSSKKIKQMMEDNTFPQGTRLIKNQLLIPYHLYQEMENWKEQVIDIDLLLESHKLTEKQKRKIFKALIERGIYSENWMTVALGKHYIEKEHRELLNMVIGDAKTNDQSMFITLVQAYRKYGIPLSNLENAYMAGRIQIENEKLQVTELEMLIHADKQLVSVNELIDCYEKQYGVKLSRSVKGNVIRELTENNRGKYEILPASNILRKDIASKKDQ